MNCAANFAAQFFFSIQAQVLLHRRASAHALVPLSAKNFPPTPRAKPRAILLPPHLRRVDVARQILGAAPLPRHTIVPRTKSFCVLANVRRTLTRQSSSRIERGFICQRFMQTLAHALRINIRTVEQHVTSILKKLELESRHEARQWTREQRVFENS